ncbi:hypothetical protein [Fodinibius sp. SL11]|uniref:hypothetical protein n=1 Tax=Fodinibius sp. SL11 TaxID=3425690 RepID=UPI003F881172
MRTTHLQPWVIIRTTHRTRGTERDGVGLHFVSTRSVATRYEMTGLGQSLSEESYEEEYQILI